VVTRKSS